MLKSKLLAFNLIILVFLSSCGTLFTGTSTMFSISSSPEKAKVYINGAYMGVTPVSTSLKRDKDHHIVVKKEGYEDATANVTRSFNTVSILNLLSPICWIVDLVTGGMWKFDREGATVELEPLVKTSFKSGVEGVDGMETRVLSSGKHAIYLP